jgi:hypothetical protein
VNFSPSNYCTIRFFFITTNCQCTLFGSPKTTTKATTTKKATTTTKATTTATTSKTTTTGNFLLLFKNI